MRVADIVGGVLFPQQERRERRRNLKLVIIAVSIILVGLIFGLLLALKEIGQNKPDTAPQPVFQSPVAS
jgi:hypothetical protein